MSFLLQLDAKKSPLALLAQTCSQIGADSPNSKLLQSAEKSKSKTDTSKDKTNNHIDPQNKPKPQESPREKSKSPEDRSNSSGSRVRTPLTSKSNASGGGNRCCSNQSAASPRASPANSERKTPTSDENPTSRESPVVTSSATKTAFTPNILTSSSDPAIKDLPLGTFKPGGGLSSSAAFMSAYPPSGFPLSMDLMTSTLLQHQALKTGALSPYLSYTRMKGGPESLPPVCRDPYCSGCGLSSHLLAGTNPGVKTPTSCPAGCTQCDHATVKTSTSYLSHSPVAAAYAHAQLAALAAASHLPYICNWIAGDAQYCGKRFSTSEELLQHLRTHTSVAVSEAGSGFPMLSPPGLPPTHPLLHRTYPTPPLSPLATARYHPYSKPSLLPPSLSSSSLSGFPLSTHAGLPPYLSPYSLYGPRIGTTPGMHP